MSNIVSGRLLRAARMLAELTQARLLTEAGFAHRACRYWEARGDNPPTSVDGTLEAIETALLRTSRCIATPMPHRITASRLAAPINSRTCELHHAGLTLERPKVAFVKECAAGVLCHAAKVWI